MVSAHTWQAMVTDHGTWGCPHSATKVAFGAGYLKIFSNSQHPWLYTHEIGMSCNVGNLRPDPLQHQVVCTLIDLWAQDAPMVEQHGYWFDSNVATSSHVHHASEHQHLGLLQPQGTSKVAGCKLLNTSTATQDLFEIGDTAHSGHYGVHMGATLTQNCIVNVTHSVNGQHVHLTKTYESNKTDTITSVFSKIPQYLATLVVTWIRMVESTLVYLHLGASETVLDLLTKRKPLNRTRRRRAAHLAPQKIHSYVKAVWSYLWWPTCGLAQSWCTFSILMLSAMYLSFEAVAGWVHKSCNLMQYLVLWVCDTSSGCWDMCTFMHQGTYFGKLSGHKPPNVTFLGF